MGELNYKNNAIYETEAPDIPADKDKRVSVLLHTDEHIVLNNAASHSLTVYRTEYYLSLRQMATDFELTLVAVSQTPVGAKVYIDFANASGEETPHTLTVRSFSGNAIATIQTSLENTTGCVFMYTGNGFVQLGGTASPAEGESQETPDVKKTVVLQAQLQDGVPYELNGEELANAKMIILDLDTSQLSSENTVSLPMGDSGPAEGAILRICGESSLVRIQNCRDLESMSGIETAYIIRMNGEWCCFAKMAYDTSSASGLGAVAQWNLSSDMDYHHEQGTDDYINMIGNTNGNISKLNFDPDSKFADGDKIYLRNDNYFNNQNDTVELINGTQKNLADMPGTFVMVYANGQWN